MYENLIIDWTKFNFRVYEFVSKDIYNKFGELSIRFIDFRLILIAQELRKRLGKSVKINDWYWKGQYQYSGFRERSCKEGSDNSSHRRGMGMDVKIEGMTGEQIRLHIRDNWKVYKALGLTGVEKDTSTWCHITTENFNVNYLVEIPVPKT
jgi:hypothetical protein